MEEEEEEERLGSRRRTRRCTRSLMAVFELLAAL